MVTGIEILNLVLHFIFKGQLIQNCVNALHGQLITTGSTFNGNLITTPITDQQAQDDCNSAWNNETFQDVAWLLVAARESPWFLVYYPWHTSYNRVLDSSWIPFCSSHLCVL
jgi:hypothetical protein